MSIIRQLSNALITGIRTYFTFNGSTLESTASIKVGDANDSVTIASPFSAKVSAETLLLTHTPTASPGDMINFCWSSSVNGSGTSLNRWVYGVKIMYQSSM